MSGKFLYLGGLILLGFILAWAWLLWSNGIRLDYDQDIGRFLLKMLIEKF